MLTSNTKHAGRSGREQARYSSTEPDAIDSTPRDEHSSASASHIRTSSSTMKTTKSSTVIGAFQGNAHVSLPRSWKSVIAARAVNSYTGLPCRDQPDML